MREEKMGPLTVRITGGTDGKGGGDGPVFVLLHGYGAPGDDLVPLGRMDAPWGTRFVFPEAPLSLGDPAGFGGGRAWWKIDIARLEALLERGEARDMSTETPVGLESARDKVVAMLDTVEATLKPSKLIVGGFSQGAMLACDVALRSARKIDGLVLLSTTLLSEGEWRRAMPARKGMRVFMSHGGDDPLLPMSVAERLRDLLGSAGLHVTWMPFRGVHEIPPMVLEKLGEFLAG